MLTVTYGKLRKEFSSLSNRQFSGLPDEPSPFLLVPP